METKLIAKNPVAYHNFNIEDKFEAGIVLTGTEIKSIRAGKVEQDGYSLVPISLYFKNSYVKLELGLGKGKKLYDKRQDIAKKDAERRMQKAMRTNEKQL